MGAIETEDVQGLVARSYKPLEHAVYVAAAFSGGPESAQAWVRELIPLVTPASRSTKDVQREGRALNVAFTSAGLSALGLTDLVGAGFGGEFDEGMAAGHRSRLLGDTDAADPGTWDWGGPGNSPIHAMLFLFAGSAERLQRMLEEETGRAERHGIALARPLSTIMLKEDKEHFGFHDGIAQPRIEGLSKDDQGASSAGGVISAGEVVLGYPNAYGKLPASPAVAESDAACAHLPVAPPDPLMPGAAPRRDLGRNGTYVVFRQLEQDVAAFWRFADERSGGDPERRKWLASKIVGRWPNGAPLTLYPEAEPAAIDPRQANDFLYKDDLNGDGCPLGAHIRRTNPRDGMQPGPKESMLVANRHRLLRRGRAYGPPVSESFDPGEVLRDGNGDRGPRGLHFICFNTDIGRQFEFVQNTWVNGMKFDGLYADSDPLIAPHVDPAAASHPEQIANFTIQQEPVRRRETGVPRFVTMRGGAYLFMPGLRALRYLATAL